MREREEGEKKRILDLVTCQIPQAYFHQGFTDLRGKERKTEEDSITELHQPAMPESYTKLISPVVITTVVYPQLQQQQHE